MDLREINEKIWFQGRTTHDTRLDLSFVGQGTDQEGPGIYFTDHAEDASRYAAPHGTVLMGRLNVRKIASSTKPAKRKDIQDLIERAPDLESKLMDWDENPRKALKTAVDSVLKYNALEKDALQQVWIDFYKTEPVEYLDALVALGFDGHVPTGSWGALHHFVLYNPKAFRLEDSYPYAESAVEGAAKPVDTADAEKLRNHLLDSLHPDEDNPDAQNEMADELFAQYPEWELWEIPTSKLEGYSAPWKHIAPDIKEKLDEYMQHDYREAPALVAIPQGNKFYVRDGKHRLMVAIRQGAKKVKVWIPKGSKVAKSDAMQTPISERHDYGPSWNGTAEGAAQNPMGWISPGGDWVNTGDPHFEGIADHLFPDEVAEDRKNYPDDEPQWREYANRAYNDGWLSVGHAGDLNVAGLNKILGNPREPAVQALIKLLKDCPSDKIYVEGLGGSDKSFKGEYDLPRFLKTGRWVKYNRMTAAYDRTVQTPGGKLVEIFKNPSRKELKEIAQNDEVRAFLVGNDMYVWNTYGAIHHQMAEELHIPDDSVALNMGVHQDGKCYWVNVSDWTRRSSWFHNPEIVPYIMNNPMLRLVRDRGPEFEIMYFDEAIVGKWDQLTEDERDTAGIEDKDFPLYHVSDHPEKPKLLKKKPMKVGPQRADVDPIGIYLFPKNEEVRWEGWDQKAYRWDARIKPGARMLDLNDKREMTEVLHKAKVSPYTVIPKISSFLSFYKDRMNNLMTHIERNLKHSKAWEGKEQTWTYIVAALRMYREASEKNKDLYAEQALPILRAWDEWIEPCEHKWGALITHFHADGAQAITNFLKKDFDVLDDRNGQTVLYGEPQYIVLNPQVIEWGKREQNERDDNVYQLKKSKSEVEAAAPENLVEYIRGYNSIPDPKSLKKYQKQILPQLKKLYPSGRATLYRGFLEHAPPDELGEIFQDPDSLVSFTESKTTAIAIARERVQDGEGAYGYAIEINIDIHSIYFHWKLDPVGREHPKEKEVLILPYGAEWEVIKSFRPRATAAVTASPDSLRREFRDLYESEEFYDDEFLDYYDGEPEKAREWFQMAYEGFRNRMEHWHWGTNGVRCWREISVPKGRKVNLKQLGGSWSYRKAAAHAWYGESGKKFIFEAEIPEAAIDRDVTLRNNLVNLDEEEIRTYDHQTVYLYAVWNQKGEKVKEFNPPLETKTGSIDLFGGSMVGEKAEAGGFYFWDDQDGPLYQTPPNEDKGSDQRTMPQQPTDWPSIKLEAKAEADKMFDRWYKAFGDDQGLRIALNRDPYNDEDPIDRDEARHWFDRRLRNIQNELKEAKRGQNFSIYRCIAVDSDWLEKLKAGEIKKLGHHWTISRDIAPYLCGGHGGKAREGQVVLEALCPASKLDIMDALNPGWSDEWEEFEVGVGQINLVCVWDHDMKNVLWKPDKPQRMAAADSDLSVEDFVGVVTRVAERASLADPHMAYMECSYFSEAVKEMADTYGVPVELWYADAVAQHDYREIRKGEVVPHLFVQIGKTVYDFTSRQIDPDSDFPAINPQYKNARKVKHGPGGGQHRRTKFYMEEIFKELGGEADGSTTAAKKIKWPTEEDYEDAWAVMKHVYDMETTDEYEQQDLEDMGEQWRESLGKAKMKTWKVRDAAKKFQIMDHGRRIEGEELENPIIVAVVGKQYIVLDGSHRLITKFERGDETIDALMVPMNWASELTAMDGEMLATITASLEFLSAPAVWNGRSEIISGVRVGPKTYLAKKDLKTFIDTYVQIADEGLKDEIDAATTDDDIPEDFYRQNQDLIYFNDLTFRTYRPNDMMFETIMMALLTRRPLPQKVRVILYAPARDKTYLVKDLLQKGEHLLESATEESDEKT